MLVTLSEIKSYLGIADGSYDTFLTSQINFLSEAVEGYCGRNFLTANYTQSFYSEDFDLPQQKLMLFNYPVTALTHVKLDGTNITSDVRYQSSLGILTYVDNYFFGGGESLVEVAYTAGYAATPGPVKSVMYSLLEEKYNKKKSGVSINFGSDVQSISIPGAISIQFDYSLQANERKNAFGTLLGNFTNILDYYRSERRIIGSGRIAYVS